MTEEERRRRCIIDPSTCGPEGQVGALAAEIEGVERFGRAGRQRQEAVARRLLSVFRLELREASSSE